MNLGETYLSAGDRARARQSLRQAATILDDLDQPTAANVRARLRDLDSS